jgi:hypothetical protein
VKLLKTIRFDASDEHVFDLAAAPDEWAVSGAFAFAHLTAAEVRGKLKQAFSNGLLALPSHGRSTFASVVTASPEDRISVERLLARHLMEAYRAPGLEAAELAAREEISFVESLCCDVKVGTVFAVRRTWDSEGRIKEEFRTIAPPTGPALHARIWTVVNDEA